MNALSASQVRAPASRASGTWRVGNQSAFALTCGLGLLAVFFALLSLCVGSANFSPTEILRGLFSQNGMASVIAQQIRLPRAALALFVGGALGASGAALQGLFRNPLAEPGVTGVTSAAGLGAVLAFYFGFAGMHPVLLPVFAVLGALASAIILYLLSRAGAGAVALVLG